MQNNVQPLVSVVIPCYNHEAYIEDCIRSIIQQVYQNIELIIIDDGSKDNSVSKIEKLVDACIERFVRFEFISRENKGLSATLNEALNWCHGQFFSPIASDDIALPHKIEFLVSKISNTKHSGVFGTIKYIGDSNLLMDLKTEFLEHTFQDLFMQENIPYAPAALLRTKDIKELGGYLDNVLIDDWYMWLKLTYTNRTLVSYNNVVTLYRKHDNNTASKFDKMHNSRIEIINNFSTHSLYSLAIKRNLYIFSKELAYDKPIVSFRYLVKSRLTNKDSLKVVIKILTPKKLLNIRRKYLSSK